MQLRLILLLGALLVLATDVLAAQWLSVDGNRVNMRKGPSTKNQVIYTLGRYYPLEVLEKKGSWYRVRDFENDRGWIHSSVVATQVRGVIVSSKKVNVRSEPTTDAQIRFRTDYGVAFRVLDSRSGWVKVKHPQGHTGWIYGKLLWGAK